MSWAVGQRNGRDIGYGVPSVCDVTSCTKRIDRGLAYLCGGHDGDRGCGQFFCEKHLKGDPPLCSRCRNRQKPFATKPDTREWLWHKLTDPSWKEWRETYPDRAALVRDQYVESTDERWR